MTRADFSASEGLVCITVTFHPDPVVLAAQLRALPGRATKLLVDNGTPEARWVVAMQACEGIEGLQILRLGSNQGLAAAVNAGVRHAWAQSRWTYLLLLDQDSEPGPGSVECLLQAQGELAMEQGVPVAVGPALRDPATGLLHGFHRLQGWRYRRLAPTGRRRIQCDTLNGSGTLVRLWDFVASGGLDEAMFIDHLDTEWSFRVGAEGWRLFGISDAEFSHRMGDASRRIWLCGWRVWPLRSPWRHRLLFRNAVWLMRRAYVPLAWKAWAIPKLLMTAILFGLLGPQRVHQLAAMALGCRDGWLGANGGARG